MIEEIATCAPVMIPTLCRYEHFKNCLESLMCCTWAEKTEVYIALDYPAQKCHYEGYYKIDLYLQNIKESHPFKKLHIIKRTRNYGLGIGGNVDTMCQELVKSYDCFIFSEDDNIFSPNFLDYCNKGLVRFREDKSVFAICGYRHFYDIRYDQNTFFRQNVDFSAWGYAIWKDRIDKFNEINRLWFKKRLSSISLYYIWKYYGNSKTVDFFSFAKRNNKPVLLIDKTLSLYMAIENMNVVMPIISLVRNVGVDGSGENFHNISGDIKMRFKTQIIDENSVFHFTGDGYDYYDLNRFTYKKQSIDRISYFKFIKCIGRILLRDWYVRFFLKDKICN